VYFASAIGTSRIKKATTPDSGVVTQVVVVILIVQFIFLQIGC
jgi:hypothetical protein